MSTSPPPKKPRIPGTIPPPTDFDEDAPTNVAPGRKPLPDMPKEFDEGGELDDPLDEEEDHTTVGGRSKRRKDTEPASDEEKPETD